MLLVYDILELYRSVAAFDIHVLNCYTVLPIY